MKRRHSSGSSASSFVTADNTLEYQGEHAPTSLKREVSPPPTNRKKDIVKKQKSATAAVEAGEVDVEDHVVFFSQKLSAARLSEVPGRPQLGHATWLDLYQRNDLNPSGHSYVVHQHDHRKCLLILKSHLLVYRNRGRRVEYVDQGKAALMNRELHISRALLERVS